eukprot:6518448-Prymnesium_polylepis.1
MNGGQRENLVRHAVEPPKRGRWCRGRHAGTTLSKLCRLRHSELLVSASQLQEQREVRAQPLDSGGSSIGT